MCVCEHLEDGGLKEVNSRCSGVERREVNRDLLLFLLCLRPTEVENTPSLAGNKDGLVKQVMAKNARIEAWMFLVC